jgi:hypothetical protein
MVQRMADSKVTVALVLALACCARSPAQQGGDASSVDAGSAWAPSGTATAATAAAARDAGVVPDADTLVFNLAPLAPDEPFQGMIALQARFGSGFDPAPKYVFTLKGKKARWDLIGQGGKGEVRGYRVYDGEAHKFFTVAPELKSILVTDESALSSPADAGKHTWTWKPFALEPHGAVAGQACDRQITSDDEYEYDVCSAEGLVPFPMQDLSGTIARVVPFNGALEEKGRFPVHVSVRRLHAGDGGPANTIVGALQIARIERGRVPDGAFDLPPLPRVQAASLDFGRPTRR